MPEGGGRAGVAAARGRRHARAGRRLELLAQQVQSRHAGATPAGLELQALPVLGRVRARLHPGDDRARAPVVFRDRVGHVWRPQNDDGKFSGPMRMREAMVQSRNLVSVRLLDAIGVRLRAQVHHPVRLQAREPAGQPVDVARHGLADADLDGARLFGVRQRRLPGRALLHRRGSSTATAWSSPARTRRAPAGSARSAWRPKPRAAVVVDDFDFSADAARPRPPPAAGSEAVDARPGRPVRESRWRRARSTSAPLSSSAR